MLRRKPMSLDRQAVSNSRERGILPSLVLSPGLAAIRGTIDAAELVTHAQVTGPLEDLDNKLAADPNYARNNAEAIEAELLKLSAWEQDRVLSHQAFHKLRTRFVQEIKKKERVAKDPDIQGREVTFDDPEAWPDAIEASEIISEISIFFSEHVILPDGAADVLAVFTAMTHIFSKFDTIPYIAITSPEPKCGKTTLLDALHLLVSRPMRATSLTPSVLFRAIAKFSPTMMIDEAEGLRDKPDLVSLLNGGYEKSGVALRNVGDDIELRAFPVFGPKVIAAIGELPATISDRSIEIPMERALPEDREKRKRLNKSARRHALELKQKLIRWAQDLTGELPECEEELPYCIAGEDDRKADNYRSLLDITESVGAEWTERFVKAARALDPDEKPVGGLRNALLQSLYTILQKDAYLGRDHVSTTDIINALLHMEEQPWSEMPGNGKPITPRRFWELLRPYGIVSQQFRNSAGNNLHGIGIALCQIKFRRYLNHHGDDAAVAAVPEGNKKINKSDETKPRNQSERDLREVQHALDRKRMTEGRRPLSTFDFTSGPRIKIRSS